MIREAVDKISYQKRSQKVDEFFEDNTINEGSVSDIKNIIVDLLRDIKDTKVLQDIMVRLYKSDFDEHIEKIMIQKNIEQITDSFKEVFFGTSGSLEDKREFLDAIDEDTPAFIIDKKIFIAKTNSIESQLQISNPFIKKFTPKIANWEPKELDKAGIGKGEVFLILFMNGGRKASVGDVQIGSMKIEVKAGSKRGVGGARLMNQHYGNTKQYFNTFYEDIKKSSRNVILMPSDPLKYNLGKNNIPKMNEFMPNTQRDTTSVFKNMFDSLYPKNTVSTNWLKKSIDKNGDMNSDFYLNFAIYQYKIYQQVEAFDGVWWLTMNGNKPECRYTGSSNKEIEDIINKSLVKVNAGINWKDTRPVNQFVLA